MITASFGATWLDPMVGFLRKSISLHIQNESSYRRISKKARPANRTQGTPTEAMIIHAVRNSATRAVEINGSKLSVLCSKGPTVACKTREGLKPHAFFFRMELAQQTRYDVKVKLIETLELELNLVWTWCYTPS